MAANHGEAVGASAAALLDAPLPWTKMRQVYALLGVVKKWGAERVEAACGSALAMSTGLASRENLAMGRPHPRIPTCHPTSHDTVSGTHTVAHQRFDVGTDLF